MADMVLDAFGARLLPAGDGHDFEMVPLGGVWGCHSLSRLAQSPANSSAFSKGRTATRAVRPCWRALRRMAALPSGVLGAGGFLRVAAICFDLFRRGHFRCSGGGGWGTVSQLDGMAGTVGASRAEGGKRLDLRGKSCWEMGERRGRRSRVLIVVRGVNSSLGCHPHLSRRLSGAGARPAARVSRRSNGRVHHRRQPHDRFRCPRYRPSLRRDQLRHDNPIIRRDDRGSQPTTFPVFSARWRSG